MNQATVNDVPAELVAGWRNIHDRDPDGDIFARFVARWTQGNAYTRWKLRCRYAPTRVTRVYDTVEAAVMLAAMIVGFVIFLAVLNGVAPWFTQPQATYEDRTEVGGSGYADTLLEP